MADQSATKAWFTRPDVVGPFALILVFAVPFALVNLFLRNTNIVEELMDGPAAADAELWVLLVAVTAGAATVLSALSMYWRSDSTARTGTKGNQSSGRSASDSSRPRPFLTAALVAGALILVLVLPSVLQLVDLVDGRDETIAERLDNRSRIVTVAIVVLSIPAVAGFAQIREAVAGHTDKRNAAAVRMLRAGRYRLQRQLTGFGVVLTLAVVATGKRRDMIIDHTSECAAENLECVVEDVPIESVLLYGLGFAAVLAVVYSVSASPLEAEAEELIEAYASLKDPGGDILEWTKEHQAARDLVNGGGGLSEQRRSFEAGLVVVAPVVTALVNAAIG